MIAVAPRNKCEDNMPDTTVATAPDAGTQTTDVTPGATDPKQTPGSGEAKPFDTSTLTDEQLQKVLEDGRLWKTPRLTELREKAKKADDFEKNREKMEQEELKKKGEFEKLYQTAEERAKAAETKYQTAMIDNAIMNEAARLGISDLEAAKLLIDRKAITVGENGEVLGIAEAVKNLATQRAYLVGNTVQVTPTGSGTNPPNPNSNYDFTMTQIQDPAFYQKNEAAIKLANSQGRIKEDRW